MEPPGAPFTEEPSAGKAVSEREPDIEEGGTSSAEANDADELGTDMASLGRSSPMPHSVKISHAPLGVPEILSEGTSARQSPLPRLLQGPEENDAQVAEISSRIDANRSGEDSEDTAHVGAVSLKGEFIGVSPPARDDTEDGTDLEEGNGGLTTTEEAGFDTIGGSNGPMDMPLVQAARAMECFAGGNSSARDAVADGTDLEAQIRGFDSEALSSIIPSSSNAINNNNTSALDSSDDEEPVELPEGIEALTPVEQTVQEVRTAAANREFEGMRVLCVFCNAWALIFFMLAILICICLPIFYPCIIVRGYCRLFTRCCRKKKTKEDHHLRKAKFQARQMQTASRFIERVSGYSAQLSDLRDLSNLSFFPQDRQNPMPGRFPPVIHTVEVAVNEADGGPEGCPVVEISDNVIPL